MKKKEIKTAEFDPKKVPKDSGVYLFLNLNKQPVYIGKAANLRSRLSSYFQKNTTKKTNRILKQAKKIRLIITDSEFAALLLEAQLINQYQPKYNTCLKDDKRYLYIKITSEDWPQVGTARKTTSKATLFGPFPSAKTVRFILKQVRTIFPYRSCQNLPPKACLYHHLRLCPAPCINNDSKNQKEYQKQIRKIKKILSGEAKTIINQHQIKMRQAARKEDYETAQRMKKIIDGLIFLSKQRVDPGLFLAGLDLEENYQNRLKNLEKLLAKYFGPISLKRIEAYDIANLSGQEATGSMVVFSHGQPDTREYRQFKIRQAPQPNDPKMIAETIRRRLNHPEWPLPDLIVVDGGKPQLSATQKVLQKKKADISVLGLAKREETIIIKRENGYQSLSLKEDSPARLLLQAIRDEAHRFAQKYHHYLRKRQIHQ
ncbi:MAG: GIY-YIG nuclease family protein [Candidatus Shapirobacteria bacterium]|nr:GIY-YIG nuclease family protein [Candidatus Shapirobacteria bacterium]MDD5073953.1 GIY-YIG nuclease family protein [Candidatus Shapirobacteria bacterium]MDD5481881.1 GIY-YIG nuclease family protein [Candidatus Shapirobacteria bacterium]